MQVGRVFGEFLRGRRAEKRTVGVTVVDAFRFAGEEKMAFLQSLQNDGRSRLAARGDVFDRLAGAVERPFGEAFEGSFEIRLGMGARACETQETKPDCEERVPKEALHRRQQFPSRESEPAGAARVRQYIGARLLDHDAFGLRQSKFIVIGSHNLERDRADKLSQSA